MEESHFFCSFRLASLCESKIVGGEHVKIILYDKNTFSIHYLPHYISQTEQQYLAWKPKTVHKNRDCTTHQHIHFAHNIMMIGLGLSTVYGCLHI